MRLFKNICLGYGLITAFILLLFIVILIMHVLGLEQGALWFLLLGLSVYDFIK